MINSDTKFRPIVGKENTINNLVSYEPGSIYFASDSGKMFLATDVSSKIALGGAGISVFYAQIGEIQEDTGADNSYILKLDGLDEKDAKNLKIDDLIINSDNCFYRVTEIEDESFKADRLVVAGTGSGGGQAAGVATIYTYPNKQSTNITIRYGEECILKFVAMAKDSSGELTGGGYAKWFLDGKEIATQSGILSQEYSEQNGFEGLTIQSFDASQYIKDVSTPQKLQGQFFLDNGTGDYQKVTKTWTIQAINIGLKWNYDYSTMNRDDVFQLTWNISGNAQIEKQSHILIDGQEILVKTSTSMQTLSESINREEFGLIHGVYDFGIYISYEVNGIIFKTPEVHHDVIFIQDENNTPLISLGDFEKNILQYDTLIIPVCIFNSNNAILRVNDIEIATWNNLDEITKQNWSFSSQEVGEKILSIQAGQAIREFKINVEDLNIGDIEEKGFAFKLKANELASNQNLKEWNSNGVTAIFSDNFDWVNGGLQQEEDENGKMTQYICVKAGTTMTINYKLFSNFSNGKSFKFIFKTVNCSDYFANAIECLSQTNAGRNIGVKFSAQQAEYYTSANNITIPYCENSLLECEIDIDSNDEGKYIIPWLDGVPVGIKVYETDTFTQENNKQKNITIGSSDCDVYIYLIKVYEKHLSKNAHLNNYIIDAPNAQEIKDRYSRNNILSELKLGEIDWKKVCENNPKLDVHLYKIPYMTYTKKITPSVDVYELYTNGDYQNPILKAGSEYNKPCTINVQGTSSAAYGLAAFNLESKFKGFLNAENEEIAGFSLKEDTCPEKSFYSKVNVASCENANNALNAYWYDKFQPYTCAAKAKSKTEAFPYSKHDTCQFRQGVLFIEDDNTVINNDKDHTQQNIFAIDTDGYINSPYYKFYSICNFGDSKKNYKSLHDPDNINEICVEVTDNQSQGQWMTKACGGNVETKLNEETGKDEEIFTEIDLTGKEISYDSETKMGNEVYEQFKTAMDDKRFDVRYVSTSEGGSNGVDDASPKQIMGFFRLVNWFASNDPCKKDEDHPHGYTDDNFTADTPNAVLNTQTNKYEVTFPSYTFKKKDWQGNNTLLGGITVATYAGTYTTDCYKYRMAKMLSECEDYLIMDSIVYHYLFIERHSMVDNVAKNTFWTSEDENNKYWCLVKDYDNDTADGNDNSGNLTLTYGYEALDKITGATAYVFNAHQSVWFNFVNGLEVAQRYMYQQLDSKGAWSADNYLKLFKEWQDLIPERIWIEDYFRKYIRPYKLFGNAGSKFLTMLEGGKKTAQRKQYETYQEIYLGTKYQAPSICNASNGVDIRGNSTSEGDQSQDENISDITIPVTMYNDCYIVQAWGQGTEASNSVNFKVRAKRGQTYLIKPPINNMNDATIYWYAPQTYSTIGDIGVLAPKNFSLNNTTKLKEFSIGETTDLEKLSNLKSITLTGNTVLRKLIVKNCASLGNGNGQSLNLADSILLEILNTENSAITDIILPNNAPLTSVKLNDITGLIANNLTSLQLLTIQSDTDKYEKIGLLSLNNIDNSSVNSLKDLVEKSPNLGKYYLKQVNWKISSSNISNNKIDILEKLLMKTPVSFNSLNNTINENSLENSHANSLTGQLLVDNSYNNVDGALEIYNYYINNNRYPNLDINFENTNCKLSNLTILNGSGAVKYKYKFTGTIILSEFLQSKNITDYESLIEKPSTTYCNFEFEGWRINNNSELIDNITSSNKEISEDIILTPIFKTKIKTYTLSLGSGTGGGGSIKDFAAARLENNVYINNTLGDIKSVINNNRYNGNINNLMTETNKYRYEYYGLVPYSSIQPENKNYYHDSLEQLETDLKNYLLNNFGVETIDEVKISQNLWLIAWFYKVDATQNVITDENLKQYFKFSPINNGEAYAISVNYNRIAGYTKNISLPKNYNNKPITVIKDFNQINDIKYIHWPEGCSVTRIEDNAFEGANMDIDDYSGFLPETLTYIGANAFQNSHSQQPNSTLNTIKIPENVEFIGEKAFYNIMIKKNDLEIYSNKLSNDSIGDEAFSFDEGNELYWYKNVHVKCPVTAINGKVLQSGTIDQVFQESVN